ncbi:DUF4031 domain-containing protein [Microbacterium sp. G2-8]|uniref:DUF4031 domain-containing protein n=1 Tax=Microbacterium sp. G2-8 TaxID=2842454 RepID=UPI001C88EDDC|nr:DUF4031 domain-containing protein [Microbacterium sp. G2-8]
MTILVDSPLWPAHGRYWSHLVSDSDLEELHAFAAANGIPRRGFDLDHYDVPEDVLERLVEAGARRVTAGELTRALIGSGLRIRAKDRPAARQAHRRPDITSRSRRPTEE